MQLPEYAKPIHTDGSEVVLSTPSWFDKYEKDDKETRIVSVFADVRAWPPQIVKHAMRTAAAARLSDGRWACVAKREGTWNLYWFANINAPTPSHVEPLPFEVPAPEPDPAAEDDDPPADDGPIAQLHAFAGKLIAVPFEGPWYVRDADGPWRAHATLMAKGRARARNIKFPDGTERMEWAGALYDAALQPLDALDCTLFMAAGGRVLALHDGQHLVDFGPELVFELPGHALTNIERGPRDTLILTIERDDERGSTYERVLYDPVRRTVATLPQELVGEYPKLVACTPAGDLVLHIERDHELQQITADELAKLPRITAAELPAPPKIELALLDDVGASARPLVASTRDAIAIALGNKLRLHTVDQPTAVVNLAHPIVAVAAMGDTLGALDAIGVLHTYSLDGTFLESRPTVMRPRSLSSIDGKGWVAVGADRIVLVDAPKTTVIELAGALSVAADPDAGDLVIACEDRRLAHWSGGELRDLPLPIEQLVAVAPLGHRKFACAGVRDLYLLDLAMPELVELDRRLRRPFIAANGSGRIAMCGSASSVETDDLDGVALASVRNGGVHYSSYSAPDNSEVTIHGLTFMDDGRIVILLDEGRANIVDPETGSALKLDPQPGDARSRWIFITGAGILVAD